MKSIEVSARTIEDAVSDGLQKLGCSISDCKVEILQEGAKGLFGVFGSKPATVRLTLTSADEDDLDILQGALDTKPEKQPKRKPEKKPAEKKVEQTTARKPAEKTKMRIASNPQVIDKPAPASEVLERFKSAPLPGVAQKAKAEKPVKADKPARAPRGRQRTPSQAPHYEPYEDADRAPVDHTPVEPPEHIEMFPADTQEGVAQQFLLEVTKRMGVEVQVEAKRAEDGHLYITMYGDTLGILIGRRGETLDALQYLTSLQVNKDREDYTRVTLDTENYRAKREEALKKLAARMASRAVKTGRKVSLEPMNPYERRILHSSLQGNPEVTTHSEGDEPYRHVVVVPTK